MDWRARVHQKPGCGVRAAFGEYGTQSRFEARRDTAARVEATRVARGQDAAQRHWVRAGQAVRLLRLRMCDWGEAIRSKNLAGGRARARREIRGRDARG